MSKSLQNNRSKRHRFPARHSCHSLVLGCLLQWLCRRRNSCKYEPGLARSPCGCVVDSRPACSLAAAGRRTLTRLGTNVSPLRPTTALATNGVYEWTRNPLYTGGTAVMIGVAFIFALDWLVLLMAPCSADSAFRRRAPRGAISRAKIRRQLSRIQSQRSALRLRDLIDGTPIHRKTAFAPERIYWSRDPAPDESSQRADECLRRTPAQA